MSATSVIMAILDTIRSRLSDDSACGARQDSAASLSDGAERGVKAEPISSAGQRSRSGQSGDLPQGGDLPRSNRAGRAGGGGRNGGAESAGGAERADRARRARIPRKNDEGGQCRIIAGLGNPGDRYASTRHNAGFLALDALASELDAHNWRARFESMVTEKAVSLAGEHILVVLAKPQTMMNLSGRAVKGLLSHYKVDSKALIVLHDDIDLPPGSLRIKSGGGHGGHNGIRDIISAIGPDFTRIKVGVGSPPGRMDSAAYVLQSLKGEPLEELRVDAARAAEAARHLLEHGLVEAQNRFN